MPQMDFSTFFPQVFWLILLLGVSFFYLLRGFFSTSIMILKLRGKYTNSFSIENLWYFSRLYNEFVIVIRKTAFQFVGILLRNIYFFNVFKKIDKLFLNIISKLSLKRQAFQASNTTVGFNFFNYFFNIS